MTYSFQTYLIEAGKGPVAVGKWGYSHNSKTDEVTTEGVKWEAFDANDAVWKGINTKK